MFPSRVDQNYSAPLREDQPPQSGFFEGKVTKCQLENFAGHSPSAGFRQRSGQTRLGANSRAQAQVRNCHCFIRFDSVRGPGPPPAASSMRLLRMADYDGASALAPHLKICQDAPVSRSGWDQAVMSDLDPIRGRETFVGRSRELAEICGGVDGAAAGRGSLFTLAGELGVGKSRLAQEAASHARARGIRVVWGRCWEHGGAPPYWPWVPGLAGTRKKRGACPALELDGSGRGRSRANRAGTARSDRQRARIAKLRAWHAGAGPVSALRVRSSPSWAGPRKRSRC